MNDMFERMKEDKRYNAVVRLSFCSLFVIAALVYIFINSLENKALIEKYGNLLYEKMGVEKFLIDDSVDSIYKYTVKLNDKEIIYVRDVDSGVEKITKKYDDVEYSYVYLNKTYYTSEGDNLVKTTLNDIYDILPYRYFNVEVINSYIEMVKELDSNYIVYLKDIIPSYEGEEYITFKFEDEKMNIDYTNLLKIDQENVENCTMILEYSGKDEDERE